MKNSNHLGTWALLATALIGSSAHCADIRDRIRLDRKSGAVITTAQAVDLTLTVSAAQRRSVQSWVRTAGVIDPTGKIVTAYLTQPDSVFVALGQRARAFSLTSKSSMHQAKITRVVPDANQYLIEATLAVSIPRDDNNCVLEIVVDRGDMLSVPNEAIIEEGSKQVVYVANAAGGFEPRDVVTGLQGELYTQILEGLNEGEQVATTGSFFIDSEYKMKGSD
jgi:Cu(I)/Ag(I) efflux system membrane fusion protein